MEPAHAAAGPPRQPAAAPSATPPPAEAGQAAPARAEQLRAAATSAGRRGAGAGAARQPPQAPVHLVLHRQIKLDVPPDQVETAVAAIVHMQPLPTPAAAAADSGPSDAPTFRVPPPPRPAVREQAGAAAPQELLGAPTSASEALSSASTWGSGAAHERAEPEEAAAEETAAAEEESRSVWSDVALHSASSALQLSHYQSAASGSPPLSDSGSSVAGGSDGGGGGSSPEQEQEWEVQGAERPAPETQPGRTASGEEGAHAPPPTPATAPASPTDTPAGGSPTRTPKPPAAPPAVPAEPVMARSAPSSPATPLAAHVQASAHVRSPDAPAAAAPPLQGGWVPQRRGTQPARSRLAAVAAAHSAAAPLPQPQPQPALWGFSAAAQPPPLPSAFEASTAQSRATPLSTASAASEAAGQGPPAATEESSAGPALQAYSSAGSSANGPQLTEIRGAWPPPSTALPSVSWGGCQQSAGEADAAGRADAESRPAWQERARAGSWEEPGGSTDWWASTAGGGGGDGRGRSAAPRTALPEPASPPASAFAAGPAQSAFEPAAWGAVALIQDSLVAAAARSPPLSPTSSRLLLMHSPSGELKRGPQRTASLSLGLAPLVERQPSLLAPPSQVRTERQLSPARPGSLPSSPLASPDRQHTRTASQLHQMQRSSPLDSPSSSRGRCGSVGSVGSGSGTAAPPDQQPFLPVLNASPDVAPRSGSLPPLSTPFRAPSSAAHTPRLGGGGGKGLLAGGFGSLPLSEIVAKRGHSRLGGSRDLSPREAYAGAGSSAVLRRPLLEPAEARAAGAVDEEVGWGAWRPAGAERHGSLWAPAALLASSVVGVGIVAAPRALALLGFVGGGAALGVTALLSLAAVHALLVVGDVVGGSERPAASYGEAVGAALGPAWAVAADVLLAAHCFGLMVASLVVTGDVLVGSDGAPGVLGDAAGDRATVLAVLSLLILAPLLDASRLLGAAAVAVAASAMAAGAALALALVAAGKHVAQSLHPWPSWHRLGGGVDGGWAAATVELLAAATPLLLPSLFHPALHTVACPSSPVRTRTAAVALLYSCCLAALLAVSADLLFGRDIQANAANEFSPEALVPLAGEEWGRAAALLIRLAAAAAAVAGTPLLMAPCREAVWRTLFWAPLPPGPGLWLVTLLVLGAAVWTSLHAPPLWALLTGLGGTGAALALVLPGLVGAARGSRVGGVLVATAGTALAAASLTCLALLEPPSA